MPIVIIVCIISLSVSPMQPQVLLSFLIGALMLTVGMGLFSLGA